MVKLKNHINRFEDYQIYLLNDGTYALINGVQPSNKLHENEGDRICYMYRGEKHQSGNLSPTIVTFNDAELNIIISFDMSKSDKITLRKLREKEAKYIGKLNEDALTVFSRNV